MFVGCCEVVSLLVEGRGGVVSLLVVSAAPAAARRLEPARDGGRARAAPPAVSARGSSRELIAGQVGGTRHGEPRRAGGGPTAGRFPPCDAARAPSRPGAGFGGDPAAAIAAAFSSIVSVSMPTSEVSEAGTGDAAGERGVVGPGGAAAASPSAATGGGVPAVGSADFPSCAIADAN